MTTKQLGVAATKTDPDEDLLRSMTFEAGSAFEAAHARVVERSNEILKAVGRGQKLDKLSRLHQSLVRVARSYGSDRQVAFQIACEEIAMIDRMKGGRELPPPTDPAPPSEGPREGGAA